MFLSQALCGHEMRYPNTFQAIMVLIGALVGGTLGATSLADIGHSTYAMPLLGTLVGAFLALLISGAILMVTNYWNYRRRDD
jgi:uncharacterized membrane protein YeaQ/YmgE (transglycosylase-associated protein family)